VRIPKDFLTTRWDGQFGWNAIKLICSRFQWVTEKVIRFVNESNLDCLFEICTSDPEDLDVSARYFKMLSAVKIDNLHENKKFRDSPHLLLDRKPLPNRDVLERLIRLN